MSSVSILTAGQQKFVIVVSINEPQLLSRAPGIAMRYLHIGKCSSELRITTSWVQIVVQPQTTPTQEHVAKSHPFQTFVYRHISTTILHRVPIAQQSRQTSQKAKR